MLLTQYTTNDFQKEEAKPCWKIFSALSTVYNRGNDLYPPDFFFLFLFSFTVNAHGCDRSRLEPFYVYFVSADLADPK